MSGSQYEFRQFMSTPLVIPVFINHQGCPHQCIYCNQNYIAGATSAELAAGRQETGPVAVRQIIDEWLARPRKDPGGKVQVAFYGGSFTGLARARQQELLAAVRPYLEAGRVNLIRLSTRPDYIDRPGVAFLAAHGVGIVELGVQSMDHEVLAACGRSYSAARVAASCRILKEEGMAVGIQVMIGLPGENTVKLVSSARQVAELKPDFVRIYPALVLKNSGLAQLYERGGYRALSLNRAISLCARLKRIFDDQGIRVVRMGLQPSSVLGSKVLAGPYHPAFGELVISRLLLQKARRLLAAVPEHESRRLSIAPADQSAFRGRHNINLKRLAALGLLARMELILNPGQQRHTVSISSA